MYKVSTKDKEFDIEFNEGSNTQGVINGLPFSLDLIKTGENSLHLIKDNNSYIIDIISYDYAEKEFTFKIKGCKYSVKVKDGIDTLLESLGMSQNNKKQSNEIKAPMPGLVVNILVEPGQDVEKGQKLLVLEAMKMENNIVAQEAGKVKEVRCGVRQAVEKNEILIVFED